MRIDETPAAAESDNPATIAISLVIPAYNESKRLPPYLNAIRSHFDSHFGTRYEIVVANDGSTDDLVDVVQGLAADWDQLRLVSQASQSGKGAAVRLGMQAATGDLLLFADADGATPIQEESKLREAIGGGADIAVGSRLLGDQQVRQDRTLLRSCAGRGFAWFVRRMVPLPVRDTQCGFKMFRRAAATKIFSKLQEDGYLFDIEVLIRAEQYGYRIAEVSVNWADQPDSRLSMIRESWRIMRALRRLRRLQHSG